MHDNRNHLGPNWSGQSPRTFRDAFPHGAGLGTGKRPCRVNPATALLVGIAIGSVGTLALLVALA